MVNLSANQSLTIPQGSVRLPGARSVCCVLPRFLRAALQSARSAGADTLYPNSLIAETPVFVRDSVPIKTFAYECVKVLSALTRSMGIVQNGADCVSEGRWILKGHQASGNPILYD